MRRGTSQEASDYCKKDDLYYEYGVLSQPKPGKRTDLIEFRKKLYEGADDLSLMEFDFNTFNRYMRTVDRYRTLAPPKRTEDLTVFLYIGKPGTGKTRLAYEDYPDLYAFPIGKDLWSDGYAGQKTVLIDDFSGNMRLVDLLRFLDRYPIQIPRKGGFNWWIPTNIIITTNIHPRDWYTYKDRKDSAHALKRRIHKVYDFDQNDMECNIDDFWYIPE